MAPELRARLVDQSPVTLRLNREQVLRYRARASHLDAKLPAGSFAEAAWGGLQDSVPRGGVISLHARVEGTQPDSWEDPSLVQIWFRSGADYIVPRADVGVFTLGTLPRDPDAAARLDRLADAAHRISDGRILKVREVQALLDETDATDRMPIRFAAPTGRVHIRWDASNIWLIPVQRPAIEPETARLELARRFLHWFGPTTMKAMANWAGVDRHDAATTWRAIEPELVAVDFAGEERFMLAADVEGLTSDEPIRGVRLLPQDDPFTKLDHALLVPDAASRGRVLPRVGAALGYIPGAVLVDGQIVGAWQRQQRRATIHPWHELSAVVREEIEHEARSFPIAGKSQPSVSWA